MLFRCILIAIIAFFSGCAPKTSFIDEFKKISILEDLKNARPLEHFKTSSPLEDIKESFKKVLPEKPTSRSEQAQDGSTRNTFDLDVQDLDPRLAKILKTPALMANLESINAAKKQSVLLKVNESLL